MALKENYLWFPKVDTLNDPFEGTVRDSSLRENLFAIKLNQRVIHYIRSNIEIENEPFKLKIFKLYKRILLNRKEFHNKRNLAGICSFSGTWDDELLWAHYSDSHRGFCIEYDFHNLTQNFGYEYEPYSFFVDYRRKPPNLSFLDIYYPSLESYRKLYGRKSKRWSYEQEIRLFKETYGKFYYCNKAIRSILFGSRMQEENKKILISLFAESGVIFYQMKYVKNSYKLKKSKIKV